MGAGHAAPVYPFDNRRQWILKNRFNHYTEATRDHLHGFPEPYRSVLHRRATSMERWARVRAVLFLLLNLGVVSTATAAILSQIPAADALQNILQPVLRWLGSLTALFGLLFLITMRILGQLEADLVSAMAIGGLEAATEEVLAEGL